MKKALLYWAPVAIYMAVILYYSVTPDPYYAFEFRFRDKVYHFGAYTVMGLLWARGLCGGAGFFRNKAVLAAFFISLLYGAAVEVLQSFANRSPEAADAVANGLGALAGAYAYVFFLGLLSRGKEERCS